MAMRYEKNETFTKAWNPRLGLTTNFDIKSIIVKPRISWGRGITKSVYEYRFGLIVPNIYTIHPNPDIKPQSQEGFDYGLEIYDKKSQYRLEAVYYDNISENIFTQALYVPPIPDTTVHHYIWSNAGGKYLNKGWEFTAEYRAGPFSLRGIFSIMNTSYVDTIGGHVISTRQKGPPTGTTGLNLDYGFARLFGKGDKGLLSLQITKLDGIVLYRQDLYRLDVTYGRTPYDLNLFVSDYVVETSLYRVGLYADYHITSELRFFVQGANILNEYRYELSGSWPPTHGATWLYGLKYIFSKSQ
jgi:outer membrane receptor protein involved in Fe transport